MTAVDQDTPGVRRAWGWVGHLRQGGTTPWRDWSVEGPSRGRLLPGAQQLELLRRVNLAGTPSGTLVERIVTASAPGRGRPDLELDGAVEQLRFGPAPVDPAGLPGHELVRVATGLLAEDLVASGTPERRRPPRPRPWRTRYCLVGDPVLTEPVRTGLTARGRPPGEGGVVLVLATDLGRMLTDVWTTRCFEQGVPDWQDWLPTHVRHGTVPPRVDLVSVARTWAGRVGPARVHLVLDPTLVPRLVGVRRSLPAPLEVSADGAELARRVGSVLGLLVAPPRRRALLQETLRPRVIALGGSPLVVPPEHDGWLHAQAVRMRDALLRAGYAVHGDPDALLTAGWVGAPAPADDGVLGLALRLLLDHDRTGPTGPVFGKEGM